MFKKIPHDVNREKVTQLLKKLEELERELADELAKEGEELRCDFLHERIPLWRYVREARLSFVLSAPVIYAMIVPAVILDLCVSVYQAVCFPLYRIPKVARNDYVVIDRHRLAYLNLLQKLNCVYCAYFNGLIGYVREIAIRTEQFWCPIRHARRLRDAPPRYRRFLPYGDGERLRERWEELRREVQRQQEE